MSDDLTEDQRRIVRALRARRGITLDTSRPIIPTASPPTEPATAPPAKNGADLHEAWAKGYERGQLDGLAAGLAAGRRQAAENLFEMLRAAGVYAVHTPDGVYQLADVAFAVPTADIAEGAPAEPVEGGRPWVTTCWT